MVVEGPLDSTPLPVDADGPSSDVESGTGPTLNFLVAVAATDLANGRPNGVRSLSKVTPTVGVEDQGLRNGVRLVGIECRSDAVDDLEHRGHLCRGGVAIGKVVGLVEQVDLVSPWKRSSSTNKKCAILHFN